MQNPFLSIGMYIRFTMVAYFDENMPQSGVGSMEGSTEGHLPPTKFVFHQRLSSTAGRIRLKVVFHRRSSSTKGLLPSKVVFHRWSSFTYHNTLVDLLFVRTVNIPNLSLLPCLEVASPLKVVFHQRLSPTEKWDSKTSLSLVKKGAVRLVSEEVEN